MPGSKKLTAQRRHFCRRYVELRDPRQAALDAGYSPKAINVQAYRLLDDEIIIAEIERLEAKADRLTAVKASEILKRLDIIGKANMKDYLTFSEHGITLKNSEELTDEQMFAVESVKEIHNRHGTNITFRLHNKIQANELLGRNKGLFVDRLQLDDDRPLEINLRWGRNGKKLSANSDEGT